MTSGSGGESPRNEREVVIADEIVYGADGYAPRLELEKAFARNEFALSWWQGGQIMSGRLKAVVGGGTWKNRHRFVPALTVSMLSALREVGIRQPASYGSCYHCLATSPRVKYTINAIFNWWPGGPWQEALVTGRHFGRHYRYDLCSAYRWAATVGLPDMATLRVWEGHRDPRGADGLWCLTLARHEAQRLPSILALHGPVVMSSEDLRLYDVTPVRVHRGVTWDRTLPPDHVERTLEKLPCAKLVGRAYWGRWIARDKLQCRSDTKQWELPNVVANFVWGQLIIARVRGRVWESSQNALHVYVDEVIVPHELPTGERLGDWRLKEVHNGLEVRATGWYGTLGGSRIMHTGAPRGMPA